MKKLLSVLCRTSRTRAFGVVVAIVVALWSANSSASVQNALNLTNTQQQQGTVK